MVTDTLSNRILISKTILKQLAGYADSRYLKFIKFNVTRQKLRAWQYLPDFWKKGENTL